MALRFIVTEDSKRIRTEDSPDHLVTEDSVLETEQVAPIQQQEESGFVGKIIV